MKFRPKGLSTYWRGTWVQTERKSRS